MRWFLMSSPILRGGNLVVTEQGIRDGVRQVIIPLWNAWYFFSLYANAANSGTGYDARPVPPQQRSAGHVLDRYILAKLDQLVTDLTTELDALDIAAACDATRGFLDVLSNWYIRPLPRQILGRRVRRVARRFRHALHGAGDHHPGRRPAAAPGR